MTNHASDAPQENGRLLKGGKDLPAEPAPGGGPLPKPVENFELPKGEDGRRIFQNGDTDRDQNGQG